MLFLINIIVINHFFLLLLKQSLLLLSLKQVIIIILLNLVGFVHLENVAYSYVACFYNYINNKYSFFIYIILLQCGPFRQFFFF